MYQSGLTSNGPVCVFVLLLEEKEKKGVNCDISNKRYDDSSEYGPSFVLFFTVSVLRQEQARRGVLQTHICCFRDLMC